MEDVTSYWLHLLTDYAGLQRYTPELEKENMLEITTAI